MPRIHVYYGYGVGEDAAKACDAVGTATLLGKSTPLCRQMHDGMAVISAEGRYKADSLVELSISLVARPDDVALYLPKFRAMLATVHACTAIWDDDIGHGKKKHIVFGHGPECPPTQWN